MSISAREYLVPSEWYVPRGPMGAGVSHSLEMQRAMMEANCPSSSSLALAGQGQGSVPGTGPGTGISPNVDDGLTSLSWLQNLNMCMTRLGAPTPPTPPASPICSSIHGQHQHPLPGHHPSSFELIPSSSHPSATSHSSPNSHRERAHPPHGHLSHSSSGSTSNSKKAAAHVVPEETVDYKTNGTVKPPYSYATLICMAMKANKNKMTLSAIYKWIRENFLYYRNADPSWQDEPGKGGFWRLDPVYAETLVDGVFKKRRPSHRTNQSGANGSSANGPNPRKKNRKREKSDSAPSKKVQQQQQQQQPHEHLPHHPLHHPEHHPHHQHSHLQPNHHQHHSLGVANRSGHGLRESLILHETPPSSAESYNSYLEAAPGEASELVNAVNSIESGIGGPHCPQAFAYSVHAHDPQLSNGYADEVCVTTAPSDANCILGNEHHEICWNAILTDADLELVDPTNYAGQVVHTTVSDSSHVCTGTTTTTQLTAVEPHTLHLVSQTSPGAILEERDLYPERAGGPRAGAQAVPVRGGEGGGGGGSVSQNPMGTINGSISVAGTDVISATHNVVTCVNPNPHATPSEWGTWSSFSPSGTHSEPTLQSHPSHAHSRAHPQSHPQLSPSDILVHQLEPNGVTVASTAILKIAGYMRRENGSSSSSSCQHIASQRSSTNGPPSASPPSNHSFDSQNSLQPWVECKAALEAAALDLEHFSDLDAVQHY